MASATLLATWFGAGTLLTSTDEMAAEGFRVVAFEPLGSGLLPDGDRAFTRPLWDMKVCMPADYFKLRFGVKAEILQVLTTAHLHRLDCCSIGRTGRTLWLALLDGRPHPQSSGLGSLLWSILYWVACGRLGSPTAYKLYC